MEFYSGQIDFNNTPVFYVYTDDRYLIEYGAKHLNIKYRKISREEIPVGSLVNVAFKHKQIKQVKVEEI